MKAWGLRASLVIASVATLAIPASASAFVSPPQGPYAAFAIKGSHGYRISASIYGRQASLGVSKGARLLESPAESDYLSRETGGGDEFSADFGHFGRISVHFIPSRKVRRTHNPFCHGGAEVTRYGTFVGTIKFRGESGYTSVDAGRARGTTTTIPRLVCRYPRPSGKHAGHSGGKRHRPLVTTLSAQSTRNGVFLGATHSKAHPATDTLWAFTQEREHGIAISRNAFLFGSEAGFDPDPSLNSATLAPSAPFSGSASFQRLDDYTTRWEGPLTVSFPGRPDVPLTGRDFSWSLTSGRSSGSDSIISFYGGFG